jgi:hypothetical protein
VTLSIDVKPSTSTVSEEKEDWYGQHQWQCGYERGWDAAMEKREWVGLTVEEIDDIWKTEVFDVHYGIARMVEAKLKEKNCG